jgi:integrase
MVFRSAGALTYKIKLADATGRSMSLSTGTQDELEAKRCEAWIRGLEDAFPEPLLLGLLRARTVPLSAAWAAHRTDLLNPAAGAVAALVAATTAAATQRAAEAADADLDAIVADWAARGANDRYVRQVRRLIPAGQRFPLSQFRRKVIADFLASLTQARRIGAPASAARTRDRYKAALSSFARYLLEQELLEVNPTRDIDTGKKPRRRILYLEPQQVRALVDALPAEHRALEALMAGTGMEWSACAALTRRDVDLDARLVYARGTKNDYRDRWVEVSEAWAWAIVEAHVRPLAPSAPLFTMTNKAALAEHHAASEALRFKRTVLHHHRHSFAVMWIKRSKGDAERLQWLKNQLGHAPESTLIHSTYGVFIKAARLSAKQAERMSGDGAR